MLFWGGAVGVGFAATAFAWGSDYAHMLFRQALAVSPWLPLLLTAVIIAGLSAVYVQGNYTCFGATNAALHGASGWLGVLLALIALACGGAVYGSGYAEAKHLLEGSGEVPAAYGPWKMLAIFVSFVSGIPGGLFAPSLSAGAGLSQAVANLVAQADPGALIVIGMATYFVILQAWSRHPSRLLSS